MDKEKLYEMREKIDELLKKHDVEYISFTLDLTITKEYYERIKHNFKEPRIIDAIVGAAERKWSITLGYSGFSEDWTDEDIEEVARKLNEAKYGWAKEYEDDEEGQGN